MTGDDLKTVADLKGLAFHIENYQRGYRWGVPEVLSLLNDIHEFNPFEADFYCLQPLVVRIKGDKNYELIDGQQRCTTVFLILKFLQVNLYDLQYSKLTDLDVDGTNTFLQSIEFRPIFESDKTELLNDSEFDNVLLGYWRTTIVSSCPTIDTLENFSLYRSYCVIMRWFKDLDADAIEKFKSKVLNHTKFIWYDSAIVNTTTAKNFANLNSTKIPLDQAELVKALFVLDLNKEPDPTLRTYRENQFATEWNTIEYHMRSDQFWYFITSDRDIDELSNKINLLLQLDKGFGKGGDQMFAYRQYESEFKHSHNAARPKWSKITELYNSLEEWYNEDSTFHLVGALINLTGKDVKFVLKQANSSDSKKQFRNAIRQAIKDHFFEKGFKWKEKTDPEKLSYGASREVHLLLLLYNIALVNDVNSLIRFPFNRYKTLKMWNIEHILAKNDDGFENTNEVDDWIGETEELIKSTDFDISENIQSQIKGELIKIRQFLKDGRLKDANVLVKMVNEELNEQLSVDSFGNLCLLEAVANIQLGKKPFKKKRDMILGLDPESQISKETYLPLGSEYVFTKRNTPSETCNFSYWSYEDRKHYVDDVNKKIKQFLQNE